MVFAIPSAIILLVVAILEPGMQAPNDGLRWFFGAVAGLGWIWVLVFAFAFPFAVVWAFVLQALPVTRDLESRASASLRPR
jgi:hypothetical protein